MDNREKPKEQLIAELVQLQAKVASLEQAQTKFEQTEKELRESEERFRTLVEQAPFGIEIFNADGFLIQVNQAWEKLWKVPAEAVIGIHNPLQNPEFQKLDVYPVIKRIFDGESTGLPDTEFDPAKAGLPGEKRILRSRAYHIWDKNQRVRNIVIIHEDITERRQADEEREQLLNQIHQQAQQVQQIIDSVPEGVLLLDAQERVVVANPLGVKDLEVLANTQVGEILTHLGDQTLTHLKTSPPKGLWHETSAENRIFQIFARPLETGPTSGGWVLVIRDVTQQREFERQVQQQERLAAIGQLAAGIAHDFNNIMATIVLYAQMTERTQGLPDHVKQRMGTINQQAKHATNLIQQILDFSRRTVLERQPLDLLPLLKEQCELLMRTFPESISLSLNHGSGEYIVDADPTRIQQMIMNLAVNARDAMPEGGRLTFSLNRMELEADQTPPLREMKVGDWVRITITDTGTGIPAEALPHIYEPFFTTRAPLGSGLGLAQVHGIVGAHEGHILVETQIGQGTTFNIFLPAFSIESSAPPQKELLDAPKGNGEVLLVVEDEMAVRRALVESLQSLNYQVMEAADGKVALELVNKTKPKFSLVLSDMVMPEMSGIALFHQLKNDTPTLPVILLTGHPRQNELKDLEKQGLSGWLVKPTDIGQLARLIAKVLAE